MTEKPIPPRPGRGAMAARMAEILRVDHAGELGAVHIYRGQRAVLGEAPGHTRIAGQLASGYAAGAWTGSGIISSAAAANAGAPHVTALGYAEAASAFSSFPAVSSLYRS